MPVSSYNPLKSMRSQLSDGEIYILSFTSLQNEMFAYVLEKETNGSCCVIERMSDLHDNATDGSPHKLLLIDCESRALYRTFEDLNASGINSDDGYIVALFNLLPDQGIEQKALRHGIRGFFYQHDALELLLKGVKALFHGETWLAREILVECATNSGTQPRSRSQNLNGLTSREMEILAFISAGSPNEEIAKKLFISPHTVKTHLYHIFKKIGVPNRLQAALWAMQNLSKK